MKNFIIKKIVPVFLSVFTILLIWYLVAGKINASLILPSPKEVFFKIIELICQKIFWINFLYTFLRCALAFVISLFAGIIIGTICGQNSFIKSFFEFPLSLLRSTPVIAVILIALYWFSSDIVPVFVSCLMTLPIIISAIITGLENSDKKLLQMAEIYKYTKVQKFIYVKVPSALPFFLNGIISAFGLTWKVVVAGEVLSLPKKGAGSLLQTNQVIFETTSVLAITLILVCICFLLERLLKLIFKKYIKGVKNVR
jgi:NitT/TauT family transport system permease protein